ncbi:MAG TPA: ABC transporter permease [Candidatus Hydrogenedentes bacterium]|nr:ABC transporter permease [Candidatus Hydrogenedentota bacterium]HQH69147.1 ABC transporter permease [Candidatus Hydrogenedentota bacterium]HQM47626.1 ABC transporter permease [Candidatus Hydrogenedentota bacterium]
MDHSADDAPREVYVIEPSRGWMHIRWRELWQNRELFGYLVWRDIKIKYKQTLLGAAWAVLVPLCQMAVFTILFQRVANFSSDGLPGPLFYFAGLLPWNYFASSITQASNSMVQNAPMLTKIYFPRLLVPATPCAAAFVDFAIALAMFLVLTFFYGIIPSAAWFLLPVFMVLACASAFGAGSFLAALNVKYRDVRHIIPFLVQIWMFLTVITPYSAVKDALGPWRYVYGLNPMAAVVEGSRWALFRHLNGAELVEGQPVTIAAGPPWDLFVLGTAVTIVMLAVGIYYFKRMERTFADIV